MEHDLHKLVGEEIDKFVKLQPNFEIKIDPACCGDQNLPFFIGQSKSFSTELTNVDLFVARNKEIKLVCEIEESNVKPGHIFGKFLSLISTDCCILNDNSKYTFGESLIFIQVVSNDKLKPNSKKTGQWRNIEQLINNNFSSFRNFKTLTYHILVENKSGLNSSKLNSILQNI